MHTISKAAYESDIASRLRNWRGLHLAHSGELFEAAAGEIERLRAIMASQTDRPQAVERTPAPPSTPSEGTSQAECPYVTGTVTRYCTLTPFTLTDAEREAIQWAVATLDAEAALGDGEFEARQAATLRGLLERLG